MNYSDEEDAMRSVMMSCQPLALVRGCVELWVRGMEDLLGDRRPEMTS